MNEDTQHNELFELTIKKLNGEASPAALEKLNQLLENAENQKAHDQLVNTWDRAELAKGITKGEIEVEWMRLKSEMKQEKKLSFSFIQIAASVALIMSIGLALFLFFKDDQTTLAAEAVKTEKLIDGSTITLNAGSTLKYSENFNTEKREVTLDGEAFFEVERNTAKPFVIHTSTIEVEVLGTSFTVRARESEKVAEVVVTSGKVQVRSGNKSFDLEPGEKGIFNKQSGQLFKVTNEDANFLSWKTREFTFEDTSLKSVIDLLNNAYQSDLYIENKVIEDCPITVSFQNQSLESILTILKSTLRLETKSTEKGTAITGEGC